MKRKRPAAAMRRASGVLQLAGENIEAFSKFLAEAQTPEQLGPILKRHWWRGDSTVAEPPQELAA